MSALPHKSPADYSLVRLLDSLASRDPDRRSFELRLGDALAPFSAEGRAFLPGHRYSATAAAPTRALARSLASQGSAASGGDLVSQSVAQVAEAARPALVLDAIGCPRTELSENDGGLVSFPSWDPEAEAASGRWIGEGVTGTDVALTVREVTASPRSALSFIKYSRQLSNAVRMLEEALRAEMLRSVRSVLERGFLIGQGKHEPFGLSAVAELKGTVTPWGSSTPTYSELVTTAKAYIAARGPWNRAHWIMSSEMALDLSTTEKATGTAQFVLETAPGPGPTILGRPVAITDHMPDDQILLVNPDVIHQVFWGPPFLLLDTYSDNMDIQGQAMLVVDNVCDLVVKQPTQICMGAAA